MGLFDKYDEKNTPPRYPFLPEGTHQLELVSMSTGTAFKSKREYLGAVVRILETDSTGPESLPVGQLATIRIEEDPSYSFHVRDIANLMEAIVGERPVPKSHVEELLSPDNPAKGERFYARRGLFQNDDGKQFKKTVFAKDVRDLPATVERVEETPAPAKGKRK